VVEHGTFEILVKTDLTGVERRKGQVVAFAKFVPIQAESLGRFKARRMVPAVGKDDPANVPEESGNHNQVSLPQKQLEIL
jgi:hypothetical protein